LYKKKAEKNRTAKGCQEGPKRFPAEKGACLLLTEERDDDEMEGLLHIS